MGDLQRILSVLGEVRHRLIRILIVLGPIFGFLLTFRLVPFTFHFFGLPIPFAYPVFDLFNNVTAQVFHVLVAWTLPTGIVLLNVGVADSVVVQLEIALLLTIIVGMPWIVHEMGAFLVPALRRNERELVRRIGIPATALFAIGATVGFVFLTPVTFAFLFRYVSAMGMSMAVGGQDFVTFALLYSLAFGVVFELPVFIYTLTRLGVVQAGTWRKHWRIAVVGSLVFGMVVTPDNSGITMLLIAGPMIALYFSGAYFAGRWEHQRTARPVAMAG